MPIHDQSYRRYRGARLRHGRGWRVIANAGIRSMLSRRLFLGLLVASWLPFLVRAVQIYASANIPQMAFAAPTAETFRDFLDQQSMFVFFVAVYAGAGLIANDRRANALQIYLSKPLTRLEYVGGKFAVLAGLLLFVTWLPAMLLLLTQVAFSGSATFLMAHVSLVAAITVLSALEIVTIALAMLALSSLSKNSRFVGIMYAGLIFFSDAFAGVLRATMRDTSFAWVSFTNDLEQIGDAIFGVPARFDVPWPAALLVIAVLVAVSVAVLERRVRGVEVVA